MAMNKKVSAIVMSAATAAVLTLSGCGSSSSGSSTTTTPSVVLTASTDTSTAVSFASAQTLLTTIQTAHPTYGADKTVFDWVNHDFSGAAGRPTETLTGVIGTDKTLSATTTYLIDGEVSVADGVTLTIEAGTVIVGNTGASYLAVDQGAQIIAQGTATNPILFTSKQDMDANYGETLTVQGQWGGLSIFGKATTNKGLEQYEAGNHQFGCDDSTVICDDNDNSGILQYVILKHTGYEVEVDKELNGLSLGGVGSATTLENIASISSNDDGVELWGGKAAITNLYLYNDADDSLDWDHGWTGSASNVYIEQNMVDGTGSRGIESDNNGGGEEATPISNPTISNITIITAVDGGQGIVNREGTAGDISKGIIITQNASKANVEVRSALTLQQGLTYSEMALAQSAGLHFSGHLEDTADKIYGDTSGEEVKALFSTTVGYTAQ
ncbi:autotransporter outer membrane beta-barrel domain-containing protein [Thiomicrolovo sp. ZZH C-3]